MWTRGAAVCSLVIALSSCTGNEASSRLPLAPLDAAPAPEPTTATTHVPPPGATAMRVDAAASSIPPSAPDAGLPWPAGDAGVDSGPSPGTLLDQGFEALSWASLPVLGQSRYRASTSYDRSETSSYPLVSPGNKDFNNWLAVCGDRPAIGYGVTVGGASCDPKLEGYLIAAADDGPGFVSRLFFTHAEFDANAPKDMERIRIYVDDLDTPAYEGKLSDWNSGSTEPFVAPLVGAPSGALVSYVPISYASKLRILLDDLSPSAMYFYQVDMRSSAPTAPFRPSGLESVADLGARLRLDAKEGRGRSTWLDADFQISKGEAVPLLDKEGPATIEALELDLGGASPAVLADLTLRAIWDDESAPAISLPLDALFAQRPVLAGFDTLPMTVRVSGTDVTMLLSLPMPFVSRAHLELVNTGATSRAVHARIEGVPQRTRDAGRLHATMQERRAPMAPGDRFPVAEFSGRGRYVGSILFLEGTADRNFPAQSPLNFLEGDDSLVVDGEVAGHGTGTEDFLDGGWYFEGGVFSSPFAALVSISPASKTNGQVTAMRWQALADAVDFQQSLALTLEYGANAPSTAIDYASVAFAYE